MKFYAVVEICSDAVVYLGRVHHTAAVHNNPGTHLACGKSADVALREARRMTAHFRQGCYRQRHEEYLKTGVAVPLGW